MRRALFLLLFVPASAFAMQSLKWEFSTADSIQGWTNQGLDSVQVSANGLSIQTTIEGQLRRDIEEKGFDAVTITYTAPKPHEFLLLWQGENDTEARGITLQVMPTNIPQTISVSLASIEGWNPNTSRIGFQFGQGTDITIQSVELKGWNLFEHAWYGFLSPWRFDQVHAYTINFLWGPLITWNPIAIEKLFWQLPPQGRSLNTVFYIILGITLVVVLYLSQGEPHAVRHRKIAKFLMFFGACWIFYDLRMGAELISYVKYDRETYFSQPTESKSFRDRGFFVPFVEKIAPYLEGKERYVFLPFQGYPYMGQIRYMTYPSNPIEVTSAPTDPGTVWVIFNRPSVKMTQEGQLTENGAILSGTGRIVEEYGQGTFIFQTNE